MPVIPPGLPSFAIRAPITTGDEGQPSESIHRDASRIFDLLEDERHLTAQNLYRSVLLRLKEWSQQQLKQEQQQQQQQHDNNHVGKKKSPALVKMGLHLKRKHFHRHSDGNDGSNEAAEDDKEFQKAKLLLEQNKEKLDILENRCRLFRKAQKNLQEDAEWTWASSHFGIETYYRREPNGSLSLKMQGEVKDLPLFEQVCVLKEVDLHYKWAPFCSSSMTVADLDKLDTVGWFMVGLANFGLARDGCFRAIGCDNIHEDGSILLVGQGIRDIPEGADMPEERFLIDDPVIDKLNIPPVPTRRGSARMTIHTFDAIINVTSPTSAITKIVANIDPHISFLPQSLLEFIMKHLAGVLLAKLQMAARKVVKNPINNEHAQKMRSEQAFYKNWLMPKFQAMCDIKGWEMPPVNALEVNEDELRVDEQRKSMRRTVTFSSDTVAGNPIQDRTTVQFKNIDEAVRGYDDDGLSDVTEHSERSIRAWSSQPLRAYLRNRAEKEHQRKQEEIREVRKMAAQRILPKELSDSKLERLEKLRGAKAKRFGDDMSVDGSSRSASGETQSSAGSKDSSFDSARSFSERVTDVLHTHTKTKQLLVMSFVLILFYFLLHPELLANFIQPDELPGWMTVDRTGNRGQQTRDFWVRLLEGLGLFMYLFLCAILHFATCDIALVYAFNSLDLASKSGRQVKQFYSDNVRVAVALLSFAIYSLSVIKALSRVAFGMALVGSSVYYQKSLEYISVSWGQIFETMGGSIGVNGTYSKSLESNVLINMVISMVVAGSHQLTTWESVLPLWVQSWLAACKNGTQEALDSWPSEAFDTARALFLYTAVPLLITLFLFNCTLSNQSTKETKKLEISGTRQQPSHLAPTTIVTSPATGSNSTFASKNLGAMDNMSGRSPSSHQQKQQRNMEKSDEMMGSTLEMSSESLPADIAKRRRRPRLPRPLRLPFAQIGKHATDPGVGRSEEGEGMLRSETI